MTKEVKIRNQYIKGSIGVTSIVDIMRKNRLRWFEHVLRREETRETLTLVKGMYVEGNMGRERPKRR